MPQPEALEEGAPLLPEGRALALEEGQREGLPVGAPVRLEDPQGVAVRVIVGLVDAERHSVAVAHPVPLRDCVALALGQLEADGEALRTPRLTVGMLVPEGAGEVQAEAEGQGEGVPLRVPLPLDEGQGEGVPLRMALPLSEAKDEEEPLRVALPLGEGQREAEALREPLPLDEEDKLPEGVGVPPPSRDAVPQAVVKAEEEVEGEAAAQRVALCDTEGQAEEKGLREKGALCEGLPVAVAHPPLGVAVAGSGVCEAAPLLLAQLLPVTVRVGLALVEGQPLGLTVAACTLGEAVEQAVGLVVGVPPRSCCGTARELLAQGEALMDTVPHALTEGEGEEITVLVGAAGVPVALTVEQGQGLAVAVAGALRVPHALPLPQAVPLPLPLPPPHPTPPEALAQPEVLPLTLVVENSVGAGGAVALGEAQDEGEPDLEADPEPEPQPEGVTVAEAAAEVDAHPLAVEVKELLRVAEAELLPQAVAEGEREAAPEIERAPLSDPLPVLLTETLQLRVALEQREALLLADAQAELLARALLQAEPVPHPVGRGDTEPEPLPLPPLVALPQGVTLSDAVEQLLLLPLAQIVAELDREAEGQGLADPLALPRNDAEVQALCEPLPLPPPPPRSAVAVAQPVAEGHREEEGLTLLHREARGALGVTQVVTVGEVLAAPDCEALPLPLLAAEPLPLPLGKRVALPQAQLVTLSVLE